MSRTIEEIERELLSARRCWHSISWDDHESENWVAEKVTQLEWELNQAKKEAEHARSE